MMETITPEMWGIIRIFIYIQLVLWVLTRFADMGMNLLTFRFLFKKKVSWKKGTGKDKGYYVKKCIYVMTPRMQRIVSAVVEGGWDATVKGIQGGFFGKSNPFVKVFGKKWGERIQVGAAMLKKHRPDTFEALMVKGTGWIDGIIAKQSP